MPGNRAPVPAQQDDALEQERVARMLHYSGADFQQSRPQMQAWAQGAKAPDQLPARAMTDFNGDIVYSKAINEPSRANEGGFERAHRRVSMLGRIAVKKVVDYYNSKPFFIEMKENMRKEQEDIALHGQWDPFSPTGRRLPVTRSLYRDPVHPSERTR
jgi:hypothetical protein